MKERPRKTCSTIMPADSMVSGSKMPFALQKDVELDPMLCLFSAVSGERLASLSADEVEGKSVKCLKMQVAKQIGATRFQQRWFENQSELDDEAVPRWNVQLVIVDHWHQEKWHAKQLLAACAENRWGELEVLLQKPLAPDATDESGQAAIHAAAFFGSEQCLVLLLEACAATDQVMNDGMTALALAAGNGHPKVVQLLLEAGADKDKAAQRRRTALHVAARFGQLEVVRLLLESRADKEKPAERGYTALHLAASKGHSEVERVLRLSGAEISDQEEAKRLECIALDLDLSVLRGHM